MNNNNPNNMMGDVENGSMASPMDGSHITGDHFTIGDDDDSTLQLPPTVTSNGPPTIGIDMDDLDAVDGDDVDVEGASVHDQLPSPEEYKAKMKDGFVPPPATAATRSPSSRVADDDDDFNVHDQLPSVDEYKSSMSLDVNQSPSSPSKKSRAGLYTFLLLFLLTAIVTAIAVPLSIKDGQSASSEESASNGSSGSSTNKASQRRQQTIEYLVSIGMKDRENMETGTDTPHYKAVSWIADDDEYQIAIPATDTPHTRFTERYVLAVLYYSAGGQYWKNSMNFLEPIDHCEWYKDFVATSGGIVRIGVTHCEVLGSGFNDLMVHKIVLPNNGLVGHVTKEIAYLHRLTHLILPFNEGLTKDYSLDGLHTLAYLTDLELQYCSFTGTIPSFIGNLRALTNLGLGNNFFEGTLPSTFWSLSNLQFLGLDDNDFSGPIESFGNLKNLVTLYLEDNTFYGSLTGSMISGWTKMRDLDLSLNKLGGSLPDNLFSLPNLEVLDLHFNEFIGPIPSVTAVNEKLKFLALYQNQLDSSIPSTITDLVSLEHLDVSRNRLVLPYPVMSKMSNLRYLFTGSNSYDTHVFPSWVSNMTKLNELSMKDSNLIGSIPTFLGSLTRLQLLDLDMNQLTGTIPDVIGLMKGLDVLLLNRNQLEGTIPASFAQLSDLDVLLLDGNSLNGTADVICKDGAVNLTHFVADCLGPNPEIVCTCCHLCCHESNATCNNYDWNVNLDPIWEYDYQRVIYTFSMNLLPDGF